MEDISILNYTAELTGPADKWRYDETGKCWCLEDILYTASAKVPACQRMHIFVPEAYMRAGGRIDENGRFGRYTARSGSGYEYLMKLLEDSASVFLAGLSPAACGYSADDYLQGKERRSLPDFKPDAGAAPSAAEKKGGPKTSWIDAVS